VYAFDGMEWTYAGLPGPLDTTPSLQTHSFTVHQGKLCAGTWPEAKVARYLGGEEWQEFGRVGEDGTEVNALVVYNGKLYGGSIPRAEVCRYDGAPPWTSLKRFYSPDRWQPGLPGKATTRQVNEWSRVTSFAIHEGRLFAGIGRCTSALVDTPADPRACSAKCLAWRREVRLVRRGFGAWLETSFRHPRARTTKALRQWKARGQILVLRSSRV
jgi:hypothetical protein